MKVVVGLRPGPNATNVRSECLSEALRAAGHTVRHAPRGEPISPDSDLYVQSGFAKSPALMSAIESSIPYIIMEAPVFRSYDLATHSSWGYNGLQGGAWRPPVPDEEREHPPLLPEHGGTQLIIGQKPTDHSLRGSDHVQWICEKRELLPEAGFRPHPLMVPNANLPPIEQVLEEVGEVYTYSSTVGVDAVLGGCKAFADSRHSLLRHYRGDRDDFVHKLSWWQAHHSGYDQLLPYILSGYDEARARIEDGRCELPRDKVDGAAITQRYYQCILHGTTP